MNSIAALILPPMLLVPLMGILSASRGTNALTRELRRKALHVAIGLAALGFPLLFREPWMIVAALLPVAAWMLAVRRLPTLKRRFGACLHDTERTSHGELYYAGALAVLLLMAVDEPLAYVIPVLILALADAAAAIVGRALVTHPTLGGEWGGWAGTKTYAGTAAFVGVAFLITAAVLTMAGSTMAGSTIAGSAPTAGVALVATTVAVTTGLAEAVSHRGSDNLTVPLVAYAVLTFAEISVGGWS